jgi:hypothetical protein
MNWRHALGMDAPKTEFTPEDHALMDALARRVVDLGFAVPAVLFLEGTAPLNYVGSQMMAFFGPMIHAFFTGRSYDHCQRLLERRDSIRELVIRIERLQYERENKRKSGC